MKRFSSCFARSPSSNPNGVSGYSGNSRSSLIPGSIELLSSFVRDIQSVGNADSEIVKNCEVFDIHVYIKEEKNINVSALPFKRWI